MLWQTGADRASGPDLPRLMVNVCARRTNPASQELHFIRHLLFFSCPCFSHDQHTREQFPRSNVQAVCSGTRGA